MLKYPPPTALGTYFLVVTTPNVKSLDPSLMAIAVQSSYASAVWLLAFAGTAVPANGTVPLMAPIAVGVNARNVGQSFVPESLQIPDSGLVLVASSTSDLLTVDVAATLDITAFIEEYDELLPEGALNTGDLTTAVKKLQVWSEAAGAAAPKKLYRVLAKNNGAGTRYLCVYATDAAGATDKILTWNKLAAGATAEIDYGSGGFDPYQQDADRTSHKGCTIQAQTTMTPGDIVAATDFVIQAYYL
jgi:hypothetical protein